MKARFNKIGNDLFWEFFDRASESYVKWTGYNDDYWWNNVSISKEFQVKKGYRLNPRTCEIFLIDVENGII